MWNVGALSVAGDVLSIGKLDFVLCKLKRVDDMEVSCEEEGNVVPFQLQHIHEGSVCIAETYWDDGEPFTGASVGLNGILSVSQREPKQRPCRLGTKEY